MYSKCYSCGTELIPKEKASEKQLKNGKYASIEHIIPNFLGTRLKSGNLLCSRCNSNLGDSVDGPFSKELKIHDIIRYPRDRKGGRNVIVKVKGGTALMGMDKNFEVKLYRPDVVYDEDGNIKEVYAENEEQANAILRRENKHLTEKQLKKLLAEYKFTKLASQKITVDMSHHQIRPGPIKKGIAKIALNFCLFKKPTLSIPENFIKYVTSSSEAPYVRYLYPFVPIYTTPAFQLYHIVDLVGDSKKQSLYCYIELFNLVKMVVLIDPNYTGKDFRETFGWNVLEGKEVEIKLSYKLIINPLYIAEVPEEIQENMTAGIDHIFAIVQKQVNKSLKDLPIE